MCNCIQTNITCVTILSSKFLRYSQYNEIYDLEISFLGWFEPPISLENKVPDVPEGVSVTKKATLLVTDANGEVSYIYIQFLSNGDTRGFLVYS